MNDLITKENERIVSFFNALDRMLDGIENLTKNYRPMLNGERYLTDAEVSQRLKISRRTLQDYRNEGKIPYCQLGGKILYRESDIEKMLQENYRKAFGSPTRNCW
jgi:excisionase family DNA binding protein